MEYKSNFSLLEKDYPTLFEILSNAESHVWNDPRSSLFNVRLGAEILIKKFALKLGILNRIVEEDGDYKKAGYLSRELRHDVRDIRYFLAQFNEQNRRQYQDDYNSPQYYKKLSFFLAKNLSLKVSILEDIFQYYKEYSLSQDEFLKKMKEIIHDSHVIRAKKSPNIWKGIFDNFYYVKQEGNDSVHNHEFKPITENAIKVLKTFYELLKVTVLDYKTKGMLQPFKEPPKREDIGKLTEEQRKRFEEKVKAEAEQENQKIIDKLKKQYDEELTKVRSEQEEAAKRKDKEIEEVRQKYGVKDYQKYLQEKERIEKEKKEEQEFFEQWFSTVSDQYSGIYKDLSKEEKEKTYEEVQDYNKKIYEDLKSLNEPQKKAVREICKLSKGMLFIDGPAGTGKTYLLNTALGVLRMRGKNVVCLAPTHKALEHIQGGKTVASFLRQNRQINVDTGRQSFSSTVELEEDQSIDYIFVDECSMIGVEEFKAFVEHSRSSAIIFFGDIAQLPPVNKEKVNYYTEVPHRIELTNKVRNGGNILKLCDRYREGDMFIPDSSSGNVTFCKSRSEMLDIFIEKIKKDPTPGENIYLAFRNKQVNNVIELIKQRIYHGIDYSQGQWIRLINLVEARVVNTERPYINAQIEEVKESTISLMGHNFQSYFLKLKDETGALVKHMRPLTEEALHVIPNDPYWLMTLSFKDIERLEELRHEQEEKNGKLKKQIDANKEEIDFNLFNQWQKGMVEVAQAYAVPQAVSPYSFTVHKSQGMTINNVFLDVADILKGNHGRKNELMYVGISRAKEHLYFCY